MSDLSQYGFKPEVKEVTKSETKSDLSSYGFKPVQEDVPTSPNVPAPNSTTKPEINSNPIQDATLAAVGGLSSAGASIAQGIGDMPTFILKNLHVISPQTADKLYKANKETADLFRPESGAWDNKTPDVIQQSSEQHPNISTVAKLGGQTAGLMGGLRAVPVLGSAISAVTPTIAQAPNLLPALSGMTARAGTMGLIGQAGVSPDNKESSFLLNAALSPGFDAAGAMLSKFGSQAGTIEKIQQAVQPLTPKSVKSAYKVVEDLPWSSELSNGVKSLSTQVDDLLKTNSNLLEPQQKLLINLSERLNTASTTGDLLNISQHFNKVLRSEFKGLKVGPSAEKILTGINKGMESLINDAAIKQGVTGALTTAKNISRSSKEAGKILDPLKASPETFNFKSATKQLNLTIEKYSNKPEFNQTVQTLQGLSKLTAEAAKSTKMSGMGAIILGSAIGGAAGYGSTGTPTGGAIGSGVGAMVGATVVQKLRQFSYTPEGQAFLRSLAKPGIVQQDIRDIFKSMIISFTNAMTDSPRKGN